MPAMFVQCRGCGQTVPGSSAHCQFCGTSLAGVAPTAAKASIWHDDHNPPAHAYGRPKWVPLAYNLVSAYIGISGVIQVIASIATMKKAEEIGRFFAGVGIVFGVIWIILGIGLLLKVEFIRGVVNFVCGIGLILGILDLFGSIGWLVTGFFGVLVVGNIILGIVTKAAMIYLVGETD